MKDYWTEGNKCFIQRRTQHILIYVYMSHVHESGGERESGVCKRVCETESGVCERVCVRQRVGYVNVCV